MRDDGKWLMRWTMGLILVAGWGRMAEPMIPRQVLTQSALTWLGGDGSESVHEVKVMSLSCRKCLDELEEVLHGSVPGPGYLLLNTTDPINQGIAWNWVTAALAQHGAEAQRAKAMQLLALYVDGVDLYLAEPELWRQVCLDQWGEEGRPPSDPLPWALGLNVLQRHNRLLGLMGRESTPDFIKVDADGVSLPDATSLDTDQMRMRIWELSDPALRPRWDEVATDRGEERPILHRVSLDPGLALRAASWQKLQGQLERGGLFEWQAGKGLADPSFRRWLAVLMSQPTVDVRRQYFDQVFAAAEARARVTRKRVSFIDGLKTVGVLNLGGAIDGRFEAEAEFVIWAVGVGK